MIRKIAGINFNRVICRYTFAVFKSECVIIFVHFHEGIINAAFTINISSVAVVSENIFAFVNKINRCRRIIFCRNFYDAVQQIADEVIVQSITAVADCTVIISAVAYIDCNFFVFKFGNVAVIYQDIVFCNRAVNAYVRESESAVVIGSDC